MIVLVKPNTAQADLDDVVAFIHENGFKTHLSQGEERTIIGVIGSEPLRIRDQLYGFECVDECVPILKPYKLVARQLTPEGSQIRIAGVTFGGNTIPVIAGPCTVESEEMMLQTAQAVKEAGASMLRGGAYKPSTSPYSFHGMGEDGLKILATARDATGLPVITEVMDTRDVELVARYTDAFQLGTRNMSNFSLLRAVADTKMPVMLKRGWASTIEEWLQAAEYIAADGNPNIILCERGIRTFETSTRNTFDINAIGVVKEASHLPLVADPSHGTGRASLVKPVSLAAVAAGADALMIEVHPNPSHAIKDGMQSLTFQAFSALMAAAEPVARAVGRQLGSHAA
jgi:3-deoxy-7-phosphoheptulonate synthase